MLVSIDTTMLLEMVSFMSLIRLAWTQMKYYICHTHIQVLFPDDSYLPPNLPPLVDVLRNRTEFTRLVDLVEVSVCS